MKIQDKKMKEYLDQKQREFDELAKETKEMKAAAEGAEEESQRHLREVKMNAEKDKEKLIERNELMELIKLMESSSLDKLQETKLREYINEKQGEFDELAENTKLMDCINNFYKFIREPIQSGLFMDYYYDLTNI